MSFKDVNELRKNGQLREAYTMASTDLEKNPQDPWAARAMFWVIHDMAQAEREADNFSEALLMADSMSELLPLMQEEDDVATTALHRLSQSLVPHYGEIANAGQLARNGHEDEAYYNIAPLVASGELPEVLHERAGWVILNFLWRFHKQVGPQQLDDAFINYFSLTAIKRPSSLHSRMLNVATRCAKIYQKFNFVDFLTRWGYDCFTEADWERKKGNSKVFPSLVEQVIKAYLSQTRAERSFDYPEQIMDLLEKAIERYPERDDIMRYLSLAHFERGNKERALELHRGLARRVNRFYVWHELSKMLTHDLDLKTSALCQALLVEREQNFLSDIHRELGWELVREGNLPAALHELEIYKAVRERNNWSLSWRYNQLRRRIPQDTVATDDNHALYEMRAQTIIDWVYADIEPVPMVIVGQFNDKNGRPLAKLQSPDGEHIMCPMNKMQNNVRTFMVRFERNANGHNRTLTITPAEETEVLSKFDNIVTGPVKVFDGKNNRTYGFVEGCFVPGKLIEGIASGTVIKVLTELQPDGRPRAIVRL